MHRKLGRRGAAETRPPRCSGHSVAAVRAPAPAAAGIAPRTEGAGGSRPISEPDSDHRIRGAAAHARLSSSMRSVCARYSSCSFHHGAARACRHRCGLSALVDFDGHVRVDQPVRVAAPARWAAVCSSVLHLQQQAEQLARALRQLVLGRPAPAPLPPPERPHQAACQQPHWPVNWDSAALASQLGFSRTGL